MFRFFCIGRKNFWGGLILVIQMCPLLNSATMAPTTPEKSNEFANYTCLQTNTLLDKQNLNLHVFWVEMSIIEKREEIISSYDV